MQAFDCRCGATIFINSFSCICCGAPVALCPCCREVASLEAGDAGLFTCTKCNSSVQFCENRVQFGVCNGAVQSGSTNTRCRYCSLNDKVPDASDTSHLAKWQKIEGAKHRVLYGIERIGLPLGDDGNVSLPLRFQFISSLVEPVTTGHLSGVITIDTEEADSIKREAIRVQFDEPQRTLVGHLRHELGHYYWECLVANQSLDAFRACFGDETNPSYGEALNHYYENGPPADWQTRFVSQYASMHPWEDFAETFNVYLDMIAIAGTASYFPSMQISVNENSFKALQDSYVKIGIVANEFNRDIGLPDLVPEVFNEPVVQKLKFVHDYVRFKPKSVAEKPTKEENIA